MSQMTEKMTKMVVDHDINMLGDLENVLLSRFGNLNGSDGILVEDVRDEIADVFDELINHLTDLAN